VTHGEIITALGNVRKSRRLSLRGVAAAAKTSSASILEWERGTHAPTLPNLIDWAEALGYSVIIRPIVEEEKTNG
jgi:transcriptional regulator with XRE-family HTH domain